MNYKEPAIYRVSYELSIATLRFARDLPEKYKDHLGLILEQAVIEMQSIIYRINDGRDKRVSLTEAVNKAYFIRMAIRLFLDLGVMKLEVNVILNEKIEEVIKQLSAWKKSLDSV